MSKGLRRMIRKVGEKQKLRREDVRERLRQEIVSRGNITDFQGFFGGHVR